MLRSALLALAALAGATPVDPQDPSELAAAANAALTAGDLEAALAPLEALAALQPAHPATRFQLGRALLAAERFDDAAAAFDAVQGPYRPTALYNAACSYARGGYPGEATARLESAIAAGFADVDLMRSDSDLASLRGGEAFARLADDLEAELGPRFELDPEAPRTWFDWWIGEWTPATGLPPSFAQTTEWTLNGTALAARTSVSRTLLNWQPQLGCWRMNWSSAFGDHDRLEGGLEGDRLVLIQDELRLQPGKIGRLTYSNLRENAFQMLWEVSSDGGETWTLATRAQYRRTAPKASPTTELPATADARLEPLAFRLGDWHTELAQRIGGNLVQGRGSLEVALAEDGRGFVEDQWGHLDDFTSWSTHGRRTLAPDGSFAIRLETPGGATSTGSARLDDGVLVETVSGSGPQGAWTDTQRYERLDADHWRLTVDRAFENGPTVEGFTVLEAWRKRG